jgi:hypothetical protein
MVPKNSPLTARGLTSPLGINSELSPILPHFAKVKCLWKKRSNAVDHYEERFYHFQQGRASCRGIGDFVVRIAEQRHDIHIRTPTEHPSSPCADNRSLANPDGRVVLTSRSVINQARSAV